MEPGSVDELLGGTERERKRTALELDRVIRQLMQHRGIDFRPNDTVAHAVIEELADETQKEEIRLAQQRHRMGGVGARLMRLFRALNLDVKWWTVAVLNRYLVSQLHGKEDPDLSDIAKYCYLSRRELEDQADHSSLDSVAVLNMLLPERLIVALGFPRPAIVRRRTKELRRMFNFAEQKLRPYQGLPWFDAELHRVMNEHKR